MPRRNKRPEFIPLDMTPPDVRPEPKRPRQGNPFTAYEDPYFRRMRRERESAERQAEARRKNGIDWSVCLVPGCGEDLRVYGFTMTMPEDRDPEKQLPLCLKHGVVAWRQVQLEKGEPRVIKTVQEVDDEAHARWHREHQEDLAARKADRNGDMYFVRINSLIKVGWTRELERRLKEYGAGAMLLCHYPATMDEETALHRQLRPSLARGREWYRDDALLKLFVSEAIKRHGGPTARATWTTPRADMAAQPRRRK